MLAVDRSPEGIARLRESVSPTDRERSSTGVAPYVEVELPPADLVYAGLSLPSADFEIEGLREQDEDGEAVSGPKHWHVLHIIARKRS